MSTCRWCKVWPAHRKWQWCRRCLRGACRMLIEVDNLALQAVEKLDRRTVEYQYRSVRW